MIAQAGEDFFLGRVEVVGKLLLQLVGHLPYGFAQLPLAVGESPSFAPNRAPFPV
jgi:hypothetical protein